LGGCDIPGKSIWLAAFAALPNWRTFYRGARFTEFVLTGGLDFYSAMLEFISI
jgi:hypothetical protein